MIKNSLKTDDEKLSEKVETVLNPEILPSNIDLGSIINVTEIQSIMNDFFSLTNMVTAILDLKGKVIEATGWQDICTKFHRIHPATALNCTESDLFLAKNLKPGEYVAYKCKNGLWDVVTPLYVGSIHLGNIFTGQFVYDDETIDEEFFIKQAERHGFDKDAYIDSLRRIPRYSRDTVGHLMRFLVKFTTYISKISLINIQYEKEMKERKKAEAALKESETYLRTLIDSLPDLVWLKDINGVYLTCNSKFERFFGALEKDIIGKTDYDFVDRDLADLFRKNDNKTMSEGKPCMNEEEVTYADDGHTEFLETIKTPMCSYEGTIIGVLGVGRDITGRKKEEAEKNRLKNELQQAKKMESIGRLAGGVAHDFNNMLSIILGNAEILLDDLAPDSSCVANVMEIRRAAERSTDLVRQLLAFARKQTTAPRVLNLNDTMESMLKMLQRLIGENVNLAWMPAKNLWPVKIDPSQVDQIMANLCVNARDAISDVGRVAIETENVSFDEEYCNDHADFSPGDYVMISVSDSGCGMDKETIAYIFEPFFTTKDIGKGSGLGLATVYGIIRQNNGFINVYSETGKGTTFRIYLPRNTVKQAQEKTTEAVASAATGRETILIVEDEKSILTMTKMMLEKLGYKVLAVSSPIEAISICENFSSDIHLLMTDVVMPDMNGRDLAQKLLLIYPNMKCLFMSGYTADVIAHHGILDEGVQFIHKPFSKKDLAAKLREILDGINS